MNEVITTNLILVISKGETADLQIYVDNKVATTIPAGRLSSIISNAMGLASNEEYDLYVKLPKDSNIRSLGVENIQGIALISTTAGVQPFTPGRPKP